MIRIFRPILISEMVNSSSAIIISEKNNYYFLVVLVLISKCQSYSTEKYEYTNFTRLCEIDDISPTGYMVRLPIYVQGTSDALIQFSQRANPGPSASVYEICKSIWSAFISTYSTNV